MNVGRASLLVMLTAFAATGCSDDAEPSPEPSAFALAFTAKAGGRSVGCEDTMVVGDAAETTVGLADLRFYVSNLKLWDKDEQPVELTLDENDFQYADDAGQVSLIDLTSNTAGSCANQNTASAEGTRRTNDAVTGVTLVEKVTAVSFDVGVPQALMKEVIASHTPEGAPSPLAELQWTWASGYRHFVMNFEVQDGAGETGGGNLHIGSRACGSEGGLALDDRDECDFVNTPRVALSGVNLKDSVIALDLDQVLAGLDFVSNIYDESFEVIGQGPGVECHSSPMQEDCGPVFEHFGLDIDTGAANPKKNAVFSVE
jgi:uncharacterized repeat protein (TIGR04052 family)